MRRSRKKYRFNRYNRRKCILRLRKFILRATGTLLVFICLISCASQAVPITLPSRPTLEYVSENVPVAAQRNLLAMITYAQRLELVVEQYERMVK